MIPKNFGELNGTEISNKNTILDELNNKLGYDKNPDVEYFLSRPYTVLPLPFGYGINYNSYGHSSVRYNLDGKDIVVNIEGKRDGKVMVVIYDTKEYLYGTNPETNGAQRGVYNRNIAGIRIENVSKEKIQQMHNYFLELQENEKSGFKKFNICFGPIINIFIRGIINWCKYNDQKHDVDSKINYDEVKKIEYGNCAKWISEGLKRAGLCTATKTWPKSILIDIFENYNEQNYNSDVNIICYQQPTHSVLTYGYRKITLFESVAPLQPIRDYIYSDLGSYAKCIVKIPNDSIKAEIILNSSTAKPNKFRNILNSNWTVIASTLIFAPISFLILKKTTKFAILSANIALKLTNYKNQIKKNIINNNYI